MTTEEILQQIPGAQEVFNLFGRWPQFHDGEIVTIKLDRAGESLLTIHAFDGTAQVDSTGHYVTEKHTLVTFRFSEVTDTEILGFNFQNVVSGLLLEKGKESYHDQDVYKLVLCGCFGAEGFIEAKRLAITTEPGIPPGSVYLKADRREVPA